MRPKFLLALAALLITISTSRLAVAQPPDDAPPPPDAMNQAPPPDAAGDPPPMPANGEVDASFFYTNLAPYGHWIEHGSDGWVWAPYDLASGWRPYTRGHWVMTDDGWLWVSDEPFGWATYHYGRWNYDSQYGWLWVPGYDWGPAWVAWRNGGGYIGWAPLPSQVGFTAGVGLNLGGVNLDVALGQDQFCFVAERSFTAPSIVTVVEPQARNVTIIHNTTNVTKYTVVNNRVVNQGIAVAAVEKATGHKVTHYQIAATATGTARNTTVRGNQVAVFQPKVVKKANVAPPPVSARATGTAAADLDKKHQQESATLQHTQEAERTHLQQIHQTEASKAPAKQPKNAPKSQPAADVTQQHATEVQAQQQQHQREQTQLANRQQAERQRATSAPKPAEQPKSAPPPKPEPKNNEKERKPETPPPGR